MRALRNIWYVAAWAEELNAGDILHRIFLEKPVVLFRDQEGAVKALSDRCPHRFVPLHIGDLVEGAIQCKYHGLRFGGDGRCVLNPHGSIVQALHVPAYPVVERYGAVWIWLGDPELADPAKIPVFSILEPDLYAVGHGYLRVHANYELESDNIMDLSHIEFLHPLFSTEAVRRAKIQSYQEGDIVWSKRFMTDDHLPPYLADVFNIPPGTLADRWLDCRWRAPALIELWGGAVSAGRPPEEGVVTPSIHFFTPESQGTTHYFYGMCAPLSLGASAHDIARKQTEALRIPFEEEDLPVLEAQQAMIGDAHFDSLRPVLLPGDAGGVRARRVLARMIAAEEGQAREGEKL
ncbi:MULTISPECIES: aromatic ring-hydroxylating dioxygenase subunit alpha [Sphingobium]|uniref:aromatic ring-hydroxylating dioxygenase subunit alpha n=1 Tax=Sphingobium TaxID=165695 RepID=UPI00159CAB93|nr:aromatic ring-hydroxylating dioxygenase subunit alpha [Sphingobium sp. 15-1]